MEVDGEGRPAEVHKRRPQLGGRRFAQCGHFSDKGVMRTSDVDVRNFNKNCELQMRTFAMFGAKTFEFFEIYVVFARTRGKDS